jgi:phosphatidate cytidylyltransferase
MLRQRVITALFLVFCLLLVAFFFNEFAYFVFLSLTTLLAIWEWSRLAGITQSGFRFLYCLVFLALLLFAYYGFRTALDPVLILSLLFWGLALLLVIRYPSQALWWNNKALLAAVGLIVIFPCWYGLLGLYGNAHFAFSFLGLFLLVGAADSGAYFAGKHFGQRKLAPLVSPNKTWEGVLGGFMACVLLALVYGLIFKFAYSERFPWGFTLISPLLICLFSITGDLFESMLKRERNIKDSGNILPGHGGILDRIDGVVAAAPVYLLLTDYFL